jgi:hypothetical protein
MKRTLLRRGAYIALVCAGVLAALLVPAFTKSSGGYIDYPVNDNGQTYGSGLHSEFEDAEAPDLIFAVGVDGTEGYVLKTDLEGTGPLAKPQNPDEALAYMEQLEELANEAAARGDKYVYYIPLYESDGTTVIGQSGVSMPEMPNSDT